ncbi:MAG: hypothetical protein GX535_00850, partial [Xanthomonadaceae bacterium]|nr:hypothetical protein [Xanthomonadaceae bacterium]
MSGKASVIKKSLCLLALAAAGTLPLQAIGDHPPGAQRSADNHKRAHATKEHAGELVRAVREATRRFRDIDIAIAEGYQLHFGCVSGADYGAMGLHYVKMDLVG